MKQLNVGFIGAGAFISSQHLKTAAESDFINIRAIAELNEELLKKHSSKYQIDYTTCDYKKLLADPEIDLVVIGTRQDTHAALIVEALDAGKWVWCEKPMCENPGEEVAILEAEKRAPGKLAIGFNRRFAPAVQKSLEIMRKHLPRPWIINYRLQSNGGYKSSKTDDFYHHRAHIIYEGCHHLDLAVYMMNEKPHRLFMSGTDDENDIAILEYKDGSRFVFLCTSHAGAPLLEKETMEIFSAGGAISIRDFLEMRVRGIAGEKDHLFAPQRTPWSDIVMRHGYHAWQALQSKLVEPDIPLNRSLVPVQLARTEQPFAGEIRAAFAEVEDRPWQERNLQVNKGWIESFQHFARCCMLKQEPETADGAAGKLANDIAYALLESKKSGLPVVFDK